MRILILSRTAWRKDNSFGNTYSNFFGNMEDVEIANIYLGDGVPDDDNRNVVAYYKISEKQIVNRFLHLNKGARVGKQIYPEDKIDQTLDAYDHAFKDAKKKRWNVFFVAREIIWKFGKVNYEGIYKFVDDFKPDIIFLSFYYAAYVDRIALFIKKNFDIPMVLEAAIDIYSMKQISFDPFFWINRLYIRSMIRRTVKKSEKLYVISEQMKSDYENMLKIPCSVLYKSPDPSRCFKQYARNMTEKVDFLFTGNISNGRWKTLALLGNVINKTKAGMLHIYTPTPITDRMKKALINCDVNDPVSSETVLKLQNEADVLVHVESFGLKDKFEVRYAISTKIMDYISAQRCILAIGPDDIASISFLSNRKLAICVNEEAEILNVIEKIVKNKNVIEECAYRNRKYVETADVAQQSSEKLKIELEEICQKYKSSINTGIQGQVK